MKYTIEKTAQLAALMPELASRDKFRSKVEALLKKGHTFEVCIAELGLSYRSEGTGKRYKGKLVAGGRSFYIKQTRLERVGMTEEMAQSSACIEKGAQQGTQGGAPIFEYLVENTTATSWAQVAVLVGKLLKDKIAGVCTCPKCGGSGRIPEFSYYAEGVCFECMGMGTWIQ